MEILKIGYFPVPRCLFWQVKDRMITKSEFVVLIILLHLENQLAPGRSIKSKRGKWFFHSNEEILSYRVISEATFMKARRSLALKGFIEFKQGHTDISSQYRIIDIEGFNS